MPFQTRRVTDARKRPFPWRRTLVSLFTVARPLTRWYFAWREEKEKETKRKKRANLLKRVLIVLLAVLCALLLLAGTVRALVGLRVLSFRSLVSFSGTELPRDEDGFVNVLLLGEGNANHDGKDLTDTIMVASIDPEKTKSVVLLSIPRDTFFLDTEKMGKGRINSLYRDYKGFLKRKEGLKEEEVSRKAMLEVAAEIGRKLGITIPHVIKVNFTGFEQAVDAVGGIDITVPYDIRDTEYPDENYGYQTFEIAAGKQRLDGATALKYARSRHTTSDFDRSARQQQIVAALGEKVKASGLYRDPKTIADALRIFSNNVEMTISMRELIGLADLGERLSASRVSMMQLNDRNGLFQSTTEPGGFLYAPPRDLFDGASVLLPISIPEFPVTWKQVRTLATLLFRTRSVYLAHPEIAVLNAGAKSGLARKLATELTRYGFTVTTVENAGTPAQKTSSLAARTPEDAKMTEFFSTLLTLPVQPLPEGLAEEKKAPLIVLLGKDYTYTPLQSLLPAR